MSNVLTQTQIEDKLDNITVMLAEIAVNIRENSGTLVLDSAKTLQKLLRLGILSKVLHPTDQIAIERETSMTINSNNAGLTLAVDADVFLEAVGTAHSGV